MNFKPESFETIEANATEAARVYVKEFRDEWEMLRNAAAFEMNKESCSFVEKLLLEVEKLRHDDVSVIGQCLNIQNYLAEKAGITPKE